MKKEPAKRENTIERTGKKVWEGVRAVSVKVVRFSFWEIAFLTFLLRLLVTPPFGAALALAAGSLWFYRNFATIEKSAKNALAYLIELSEEEQEEYEASLWFRGSGRDEIQAVIGELSNHKINACDLVQQIEDFPPRGPVGRPQKRSAELAGPSPNHRYRLLHHLGIKTPKGFFIDAQQRQK